MRQRVKRRLFMMSMAVATGSAGPAFAKGGGKVDDDLRAYIQDWRSPHVTTLPHAATGASPADKGWRLELLPPETRSHFDRDTSPHESKRFGLALRMAF
ncbi:MAG: hypothetical protein HGA75_19185 [Thiobacillus sp.]|nr:hypothetical protein [Thiobacillus sp.]